MKICYLADVGVDSVHGLRWANYFAKNGHEVYLISLRETNENIKDITLHIIKMCDIKTRVVRWAVNSLPILLQTKRLLKKIEPDILHAHCAYDYGIVGALSNFHPFVVSVWGSDVLIAPKESTITKYSVKFTLKKADLITCDAEHIEEPLIQLGADPQKISLIYHGTDTRKFNPGKRDESLREELGIHDAPAIISLRRLNPIYDIESLIAAIPTVLKEFPKAEFVIAGSGSQEVKLKERAKSLGVLDSVKFIGWIPNDDELSRYLASADIYVSTSLSDAGLAASTAEAMACGLPVIITDFGDNRKWVEDGVNGFIIPLKDPKALAEKIIYLLKTPDVRKEFGKRNRKIIEERNNYHKEMEKMENSYIELVEGYKT